MVELVGVDLDDRKQECEYPIPPNICSPHIIQPNWFVPTIVVVIYMVAVQKMNVHWFRITKSFVCHLTSIIVDARHFATPFRQQAMSDEELHEIISILHTLYLVLVPIHINTNIINIANLLVSE